VVAAGEGVILGLGLEMAEGQPEDEQTIKGTKFDMLFPALLPLVGPGAITPTKKVPGVLTNEAGMLACTCVEFSTVEGKFVLGLLEAFQVTIDPATNPAPVTVKRISCCAGATAPLGVMEVIEELTVGVAPR